MDKPPRTSRRTLGARAMQPFSGLNGGSSLKSLAWLLRLAFVVAVIAAVWLTRPVEQRPSEPVADETPPHSAEDPHSLPRPSWTPRDAPVPSTNNGDLATDGKAPRHEDEPAEPRFRANRSAAQPSHDGEESAEPASAIDAEIRRTVERIDSDGPFPYRQDNTVFVNREGRLPKQPLGYYREFTVKTPGADDRGPRRIVRGERGELYYTEDHYRSFKPLENRPGAGPPSRNRQPSRDLRSPSGERSR